MAKKTIPRKYVRQFTKLIDGLSDDIRIRLMVDLEKVDLTDIALARDVIIEIMEMYLGPYTDMAAQVAASFYEGVRNYQIGGSYKAIVDSGRIPEATENAVRAFMQIIVDGKEATELYNKLTERADYELKRAAGECVYRNGDRDKHSVRFARVPSGIDTCEFCMMLADRGFVYRSSMSAGELNHYHANCQCRIVPSFVADSKIGK